MSIVDNNGISIHYETEGEGPPLVLMHGMGGSIDNWYRTGYVEVLENDYRLILIDSRGFGESGKPHDVAAYSREAKVSDVIAVLDDLGVPKTHYWGYSMGASIGWALGMLQNDRVYSLVLGGYPVLPEHPSPDTVVRWKSRAKLMRSGMDLYIAALEMDHGPMPQEQRDRLMANDGEAYACQQLANLEWGVPNDAIKYMTAPALVYSGTEDHEHPGFNNHEITKSCAKVAPNAFFIPVPGHTHGQTFQDKDFILPHATKFLAEMVAQAKK